ncbi:citrate lyase subunit beta/citryl-CoA lyase [Spinactinospora alkalitolerans]|uniref:Citrate lyase subunit beta/citryl-CoA lyase n=1 Tax=Spinactinospora alkalitolerans TaxID=687207 RepID=A0A852TU81_9ACTN|nr:CoA ester lyase [Spinactinospora alkalitolerans]NYE47211.1 citrate lyase subunit beta/citryl-CoA lyase [Spinactinospora alkalitolerans]
MPGAPGAPPLTLLYVPGDRPDRVRKALAGEADVVIVDLEDAVAPAAKAAARSETAALLSRPQAKPVQVRVNDVGTDAGRADLAALAGLPGLGGVRVPKVEEAATLTGIADALPGAALHVLLESALGVERAHALATAHPAVASIALGEVDLGAELGVSEESGLLWARSRTVVAARAAGLPAPAQSVYARVRDLDGLAASCRAGRALGFLGRTAIHPAQLPVIARSYLPDEEEVAAARGIVAAAADAERSGTGALALPDGRFVDVAVVRGAERTLALAERAQSRGPGA